MTGIDDWLNAGPLLLTALIALIVVLFLLKGIYLIREYEVGIQTKKFLGKRMPQGQVIARTGEIGVLASTLMPGLYYRFPVIWSVHKVPIIEVGEAAIAVVEAIDGRPLPAGRRLGDEVDCNQFQDAEKFLDNGGFKGPQVGILRPGKYRINTRAFAVNAATATVVKTGFVGKITAQDGRPLPSRMVIAPTPDAESTAANPKGRSHGWFQDGQAFIESGGYRGPQLETLQPGTYYINTLMFGVITSPVYEVPPGFVAVIRSNVGVELERPEEEPTEVSTEPDFEEKVTKEVEKLLTNDKNTRGIYREPIAPGKYNLNDVAYTAYLVPTSAIMVDWAAADRSSAPQMGRAAVRDVSTDDDDDSGRPKAEHATSADYNYLTDITSKGADFFKFEQLKVTSKDGFQLEVDVRIVIRIQPENAAFVIARFGSVFNLIQQIVHPLIDAEFRNNAGGKKALEFVQSRSALQQEALDKAREKFKVYLIEAQNLLISYIAVDPSLLATQTLKEIALQQQTQFQEQAKAAQENIDVQNKMANAALQPKVVAAQLQIDINKNLASALIEESIGIRQSTINKAEGEKQALSLRGEGNARAVQVVGVANAAAYRAQTDVLGPERTAVLKALDEISTGGVVITPEVLVNADGAGGATGGALLTWLLTQLVKDKPAKAPVTEPVPEATTTTG